MHNHSSTQVRVSCPDIGGHAGNEFRVETVETFKHCGSVPGDRLRVGELGNSSTKNGLEELLNIEMWCATGKVQDIRLHISIAFILMEVYNHILKFPWETPILEGKT
jgi:hypothetical protein